MKCACQWVDAYGEPTPDDNEAIGLAVCYNPDSFPGLGSKPFPICEAHASKKSRWWKILPLPDQETQHPIVERDAREFPRVPNEVQVEKLKEAFAKDYRRILNVIKYDTIMGCFTFQHGGVFWGLEEDGYLHT